MVRIRTGNLFDSSAQTWVNTVNCVGVMGAGIALEFKKRFPEMFEDYVERCRKGEVKLGRPYLYRRLLPPWILNFPTKDHWRSVSKLSDIVQGLEYLEQHYQEWGITSLAVPPLGCGQGQLEWSVVGRTLYRHLSRLTIPVELYAPRGTPQEELDEEFLAQPAHDVGVSQPSGAVSKISPAWIALVDILARIEREPYHWPVGRTTFQKIAYFATAAGLPTGLRFARSSYGPFSSDMKSLLTTLVNHGLIREERLGRMLEVKPGPTYKDAAVAFKEQLSQWKPLIEHIADLFLRMRTQQAGVAATVHFAAEGIAQSEKRKPTELEVLEAVKQWKQKRRPALTDQEVASAIRNLNVLRWLDAEPSRDLPLHEEALADI